MLKKLGRQKKLENTKGFRIKYGTLDFTKPKSLYLVLESWVKPELEANYNKEVIKIEKLIERCIYNNKDLSIFKDNIIVDVDLRSSGMSTIKRSFMNIEVTLFPNTMAQFPNAEYTNAIHKLSNHIVDDLNNNNNYTFKTTKH